MTIGLLTLMHGHNYGGILQCYALQQTLEALGHRVEIIDYHYHPAWRAIRRATHIFGRAVGSKLLYQLGAFRYGRTIHQVFETFMNEDLSLSIPCSSDRDLQAENLRTGRNENFSVFFLGFRGYEKSGTQSDLHRYPFPPRPV